MPLVLFFYAGILAAIGALFGYFLATIPILILVAVGVVLIFWILKDPHPGEGGINSAIMALAVMIVLISAVITGLAVRTTPILNSVHGFSWHSILRQ